MSIGRLKMHESTTFRRYYQFLVIALAALANLLMSGPLFGFTELKAGMLKPNHQAVSAGVWCGATPRAGREQECKRKADTLDVSFQAACFVSDSVLFLYGQLSDRYGPKASMLVGLVVSSASPCASAA